VTEVPKDARTREVDVPCELPSDRPFVARLYEPTRGAPEGVLLLVPGLHFAGPDDPRMDRFGRVLASAGVLVLAPFLPDFAEMRVADELVRDTTRAFDLLESLPERPRHLKPGVFSISFGSLPALRLASSATHAARVGGLVVFGGYADFVDAIRFCLSGREGLPHDPLNRPVVFLNLLEHLEGAPRDPRALVAAWKRFVVETWGNEAMKERERYVAVARAIAESLDAGERALFSKGCGAEDGGVELGLSALARSEDRFAFLDPRPHLAGIRCPVHIVHGRDDDVIPVTHAALLADAMPEDIPVHTWLTGFYAHTSTTGLATWLGKLPLFAGELRSMLGILRAIREVTTQRVV
jgi:pimeloyl-ACP methyl ester carboxylesterase